MKEQHMRQQFEMIHMPHTGSGCDLTFLSKENAEKIRTFHKSFPVYAPTPLAHLPITAEQLGLQDIYVKDESYRFDLNAFKVLLGIIWLAS